MTAQHRVDETSVIRHKDGHTTRKGNPGGVKKSDCSFRLRRDGRINRQRCPVASRPPPLMETDVTRSIVADATDEPGEPGSRRVAEDDDIRRRETHDLRWDVLESLVHPRVQVVPRDVGALETGTLGPQGDVSREAARKRRVEAPIDPQAKGL